MTPDDPERQLSAALRAQAAGLAAGHPVNTGAEPAGGGSGAAQTGAGQSTTGAAGPPPGPTLPGWQLLGLAVLLGGLAGGLAGAISAW